MVSHPYLIFRNQFCDHADMAAIIFTDRLF